MRQDIISHRLLILVPLPSSLVLLLSKGERKYVRLFIKITLGYCLGIFLSLARSGGNRGIRDNSDQRDNVKRFQEPVLLPPRSAPTSGLSIPVLSPRRLSSGDFFSSAPPGSRSPMLFSARAAIPCRHGGSIFCPSLGKPIPLTSHSSLHFFICINDRRPRSIDDQSAHIPI